MKKRFLFAALVLLVAASSAAQLLVRPNGTVRIGPCPDEDSGFILPEFIDSISALHIIAPGDDPVSARITFGQVMRTPPLYAAIGRHVDTTYTVAKDRIWMHGRNGFCLTQGNAASDTILQFKYGESFINCKYPVKSEGILLTSDERYKEDVNNLEDALQTLSGLRGVTYHYKARQSPEANLQVADDEAMRSINEFNEEYANLEAARAAKLRYGFIAQEVEQVMPELVERDADGMLSVDYIAVIPILVNAVNELSARNEQLENELRQLSAPEVNYAPSQNSGVDQLLTDRSAEVLGQNDPNPFSSDTRISYNLPEGTTTAMICIYDLQGKQVQQLPVTDMGAGSVTLHGGNLQAGMYIYSLIANGRELASKKMILTK